MQSRGLAFCVGAVVGLGGAVGVFRLRPQLVHDGNETDKLEHVGPATLQTSDALFRYGYPEPHISTHSYAAHSLIYDRSKKVPVWVAETITNDMVKSSVANRKRSKFRPDSSLFECHSSANDDYHKSGWSRGHMAPAGNYKHCQNSMDDTFFLTNIVPQDLDNNSGYWNSIEDYCRKLTKKYKEVSIVSGPLYLPEMDSVTGKKFVKYEMIGKNCVAVPTHLFKIILADDGSNTVPVMGVFIVPNCSLRNISLTNFQVSLEELEAHTGITFHSKLDRSKVRDLCTTDGCKLMSVQEWALIGYQKRVRSATTVSQLEDIWQEMESKIIQPDKRLKDLYKKRRLELDAK